MDGIMRIYADRKDDWMITRQLESINRKEQ